MTRVTAGRRVPEAEETEKEETMWRVLMALIVLFALMPVAEKVQPGVMGRFGDQVASHTTVKTPKGRQNLKENGTRSGGLGILVLAGLGAVVVFGRRKGSGSSSESEERTP